MKIQTALTVFALILISVVGIGYWLGVEKEPTPPNTEIEPVTQAEYDQLEAAQGTAKAEKISPEKMAEMKQDTIYGFIEFADWSNFKLDLSGTVNRHSALGAATVVKIGTDMHTKDFFFLKKANDTIEWVKVARNSVTEFYVAPSDMQPKQ